MLTRIIEEVGTVNSMTDTGASFRLGISCKHVAQQASRGDSVAVNGICLTVTKAEAGS